RLENIEAINREAYALVRGYLGAHREEIDVADLDLAAFVLVTVVEALTHAAVLRRPDILRDEKARRFVDDVTRLEGRALRTSTPAQCGQRIASTTILHLPPPRVQRERA